MPEIFTLDVLRDYLLVGAALVWCDYHWASDVLAGWALSALIVWLALRVPLPRRLGG